MTDQDLPYLRELESVDSTGSGREAIAVLSISSMLLPMLALFGYGYWRFHEYFEPGQQALFAVIPALLLVLLLRWLFTFARIATGLEGVTLAAVLRRKFIPWASVLRASSRQTSLGKTIITLNTNRGPVRLDAGGMSGSSVVTARIAASVGQHLRRNGIQNDVSLSETDLSFWHEIGEEIPRETEWRVRKPKGDIIAVAFIAAMFLVLVIGFGIDGKWDLRSMVPALMIVPAGAVMLAGLLIPEVRDKAYAAAVDDDAVDLDLPFGKRRIPWDCLVRADWHRGILLTWQDGRKKRTVTIPYEMGKTESETLMLAIIRNLRGLPNPVAMPFPETVKLSPESLRRPVLTSQRRGMVKMAFINTLEPELGRKMTRLYRLNGLSCLLGMIPGLLSVFLDPMGMLSKMLHGADARFFFAPDTMCLGLPMMLGGIVVFGLLGEWAAGRLAGADRETWEELKKVAPPSRFERWANAIVIALAAGAILVAPLMVDCYWKVTDRGIEFSRLWDAKHHLYTWSDIEDADAGTFSRPHEGHYDTYARGTIRFRDGNELRLDESKAVWRNGSQAIEAMEFVAERTGARMERR